MWGKSFLLEIADKRDIFISLSQVPSFPDEFKAEFFI